MIEDLVVGLARDGFAILEAWGHEGDARLRLISVVVLKEQKLVSEKTFFLKVSEMEAAKIVKYH